MAKRPTAGNQFHRIAFDKRITANPDHPIDLGNTVSAWAEQFQCRAEFIHLRGGESVMAGRLQGKHSVVIRVRATSFTGQVSTDWRVRDCGAVYNIRDITPSENDRQWLDILCERGVAS